MGTFTKAQLFKTVRVVEIEGKLDEIEQNAKTVPILQELEKLGLLWDFGFKIKFAPPKCPICKGTVLRAMITDQNDKVLEIRLFCRGCCWTEEMPK